MSLDHGDDGAVSAFAAEIDQRLGRGEPRVEPWGARLAAVWLIGGALITLAVLSDGALSTVLYLVALLSVAVWVAGFYMAREGSHWFGR